MCNVSRSQASRAIAKLIEVGAVAALRFVEDGRKRGHFTVVVTADDRKRIV